MFCYVVKCTWGWDGREEIGGVNLIIPPIPMVGSTAAKLWQAVCGHPWTKPIRTFTDALLLSAKHEKWNYGCEDSASSNHRLSAIEAQMAPPGVAVTRIACKNHQNFIGETAIASAVLGLKFLYGSFSTAKFLNRSNHLLRLRMGLHGWISRDLVLVHGDPNVGHSRFIRELFQLFDAVGRC